MSIRFSSQNENFTLADAENIALWLKTVIERRGKQLGKIDYVFCCDEEMLKFNQHFLDHDTYTDIITFDNVVGNRISGDIIISTERVAENAATFGVPIESELKRVIVHGVLHLLGQGDKSDSEAREMRRQEEEALALWLEMEKSGSFHKEHEI